MDTVWTLAKIVLGLEVVVLFHLLGHLLAAKLFRVPVEIRIGFGPAIPGCRFSRGRTSYILAFSLPATAGASSRFPAATTYAKVPLPATEAAEFPPIWKRLFVAFGGVIMNVILAWLCFSLCWGHGKERSAAVISQVDAGSPAWKKGLPTGAVIQQIGAVQNPFFEDLMTQVLGTVENEKLRLVYSVPGGPKGISMDITPHLSRDQTRPMLGVSPALRTVLAAQRDLPPSVKQPVWPHSVAALAENIFQCGDRIIAITDPDAPAKIKDLPSDPRHPEQPDYFKYLRRMQRLAGKEVTLRVERDVEGGKKTVDIKVPPAFHYTFGARMQMGPIVALREGSPADKAGVRARDPEKHLEGDRILKVEVKEPDGKITRWGEGIPLDPLRLPDDLKQWARRTAKKKVPDWKVTLHVQRHRAQGGLQFEELDVILDWDNDWQFDRVLPFNSGSPQAIAELGLAYRVQNTVAYVSRADADGLRENDDIIKVRFFQLMDEGMWKKGPWVELEPEEFAWVFSSFQFPGSLATKKMTAQVKRDNEIKEIEIEAARDPTWPLADRGLILARDMRVQKADNILDALGLGLGNVGKSLGQLVSNLRGLVMGRIATTNLGGPVTVSRVAYRFADYDLVEFLFFLAMISLSFSVLNLLPIPVLDGGEVLLLVVEKLNGKPLATLARPLAYAVGLILLSAWMLYGVVIDLQR